MKGSQLLLQIMSIKRTQKIKNAVSGDFKKNEYLN